MLFDYRFQFTSHQYVLPTGCDLMLFDYRFQSTCRICGIDSCCDLMLFDYRFQYWTMFGLY